MKKFITKLLGLRQSKIFMNWVCNASPYEHFRAHLECDDYLSFINQKINQHIAFSFPNKTNDEYLVRLIELHELRRGNIEELYDIITIKMCNPDGRAWSPSQF